MLKMRLVELVQSNFEKISKKIRRSISFKASKKFQRKYFIDIPRKMKEFQNRIPLFLFGLGFVVVDLFFIFLFMREMYYLFFINNTYDEAGVFVNNGNFLLEKFFLAMNIFSDYLLVDEIELFTRTVISQNIEGTSEMFIFMFLIAFISWVAISLLLFQPLVLFLKKIKTIKSKDKQKRMFTFSYYGLGLFSFFASISLSFLIYCFSANAMCQQVNLEKESIKKSLKSSFLGNDGDFEMGVYYGHEAVKAAILAGNEVVSIEDVETVQDIFDFYITKFTKKEGTFTRAIAVPNDIEEIEVIDDEFMFQSILFPSGEIFIVDMNRQEKEELLSSIVGVALREYFSGYTDESFREIKITLAEENDLQEYREEERSKMLREIDSRIWQINNEEKSFNETIELKNNEIIWAKRSLKQIKKDKEKYVSDQRDDYKKYCDDTYWEKHDVCKNKKKQIKENDKVLDAREADRENTIAKAETEIERVNSEKNAYQYRYGEIRSTLSSARGKLDTREYEYVAYDVIQKTVLVSCSEESMFSEKCLSLVVFGFVDGIGASEKSPWPHAIDAALISLITEDVVRLHLEEEVKLPFDYNLEKDVLSTITSLEGVGYEDMKHLYLSDRSNVSFEKLLKRVAPSYNKQGNFVDKLKILGYTSDKEIESSLVESLNKSLKSE